ncbi:MAG: hypothetical protein A2177_06135 [Spirochaetes bacterium RBG_13_68_11]|nr:MAG: hypothetical protein A2177_06135 [Spirochaetes bacterium RBG_13_68_11]
MGFSASGYTFMHFDPVRVDTADANEMVIRLKPLTDVLYSVKDVHCTIYETDGTTEITDATLVRLAVLPMNGIVGAAQTPTHVAGAPGYYSLAINRHSADCLALIWVERPATTLSFSAHLTGVDLSGSEPITLRFDEPAAGDYRELDLTAETIFSEAEGQFVSPYGLLPVVCKYVDDDGPQTLIKTTVEFSDGTMETVTFYNPDNWPCFWMQRGIDATYVGTSARVLMSTTAIGVTTGDQLTLPALSAGLGPSSDPDLGSWAYDAIAGSISIDPITDAQLLQFTVLNTEATPDINVGTIVSFSNPQVLPTWVNDLVSYDSPRTMLMMPMDTDLAVYELDMVNRDTYPASAHFGVLLTSGTYQPFSKDFAF